MYFKEYSVIQCFTGVIFLMTHCIVGSESLLKQENLKQNGEILSSRTFEDEVDVWSERGTHTA